MEKLAALAALISAIMAFASWYWNREITQATISLTDVKVNAERIESGKLKINFLFIFKNIGNEKLKINKLQLGHFNFNSKIFEKVGKKPILNPINGGSIFNYSNSFIYPINPQIPDKKIGSVLPNIIGKHALILCISYKGKSVFSIKEKSDIHYFGYDGHAAIYQLTEEEYGNMKDDLPSEFKI